MATFTNEQKLQAIEREIRYRERVYANRVAIDRMTRAKADYEVAVMKAIADDYRRLAEGERLI